MSDEQSNGEWALDAQREAGADQTEIALVLVGLAVSIAQHDPDMSQDTAMQRATEVMVIALCAGGRAGSKGEPMKITQAREVLHMFGVLGPVEREVWLLIGRRLLLGQGRYGMLQPNDPRDWERERGEEAADWLVYDAVSTIMGREARK